MGIPGAIARLGVGVSLVAVLLGGATPSPGLMGMGNHWRTRSLTAPPLMRLTQGRPLTFLAYGRQQTGTGEPTVTRVYPVASDVLAIEIETGRVEYGQQMPYVPMAGDRRQTRKPEEPVVVKRQGQPLGRLVGADQDILYTYDRFFGSDLDTRWADRPQSYRLTPAGDAPGQPGQRPEQVFRKSKPTNLAQTAQGQRWPMGHTLYLHLPQPMMVGQAYELSFQGQPWLPIPFTYDPQRQRSEAVHVSQTGFRPQDPVKVGFLSIWMGSGSGLDYPEGLTFWLVDEATDQVVYAGRSRLSVAAETPEDPFRNYNQTDVYALEFHDFQQPGVYRLCVETVGCSFPFPVQETVWQRPFVTSVRGLYHQRSGLALGPPYTDYRRPRAFHPDDGVVVYQSRATLMETKMGIGSRNPFEALLAGKTETPVPRAWGGYFDAGDWDRRIQHLAVARSLLELAELFPRQMAALSLNIPESDNALPDVVDEALWGVDLFRRLQKPDGGVPGGIESAAHPRPGEASWQESLTVMAYAPDIWSSYLYAGVAARAAYGLRQLDASLAREYQDSALRAMAYAERRYPAAPPTGWPFQVRDARNLAALELWRLAGNDRWHQLFLETTVFQNANQPVARWGKHDQAQAAFLYARLDADQVNPTVQAQARRSLLAQADTIAALTQQTGFQWTKEDPHAPVGWGISWGSPGESALVLQAHYLTQNPYYLEAALRATQFPLGANPDNLVYTTGLGDRSPQHPLIVDQRILGVAPPPGITVYGPIDISRPNYQNYWFMKRPMADRMFPEPAAWPPTEAYVDVYINVAMTEYTLFQTIGPTAYVWGYLAAQD